MKPTVFWITGLPGAGKTTLAKSLVSFLKAKDVPVIWLDGDELRLVLDETSTFKVSDRLRLAHTYRKLSKVCLDQGLTVVTSTVSLFHEIHAANRNSFDSYFEIFLDTDLKECKSGPRSHLYGLDEEVNPFLGFEPPLNPHLSLSPSSLSRNYWAAELVKIIEEKFL